MTEDDLAAIKEELSETGYVRRKTVRKKIKLKNEPLHYISSDGFHMYVGKNNLQNDALTFDFAAGCDWWFHAKQAPGSHVIVKTNGEELPDRTFEEAGKLAAYYSSMRGSEKVEIDYIEKKHIKKPKGAKPGFVVYYTNYSLVIDSDIRGTKKYPAVRISKGVSILSARLFTVKTSQGVKHAEKHRYMSDAFYRS